MKTDDFASLLETFLRPLLSSPNSLKVVARSTSKTLILIVSCEASERGKLLGKGGILWGSFGAYFRALGAKHSKRIYLELSDEV